MIRRGCQDLGGGAGDPYYPAGLAERHGAKPHAHGRTSDALTVLAPLYAGFTEGFATRDPVEAKAPLDELGDPAQRGVTT